MRFLFLFGSLLVVVTTVAQTQKASDVADFVSIDTPVTTSPISFSTLK